MDYIIAWRYEMRDPRTEEDLTTAEERSDELEWAGPLSGAPDPETYITEVLSGRRFINWSNEILQSGRRLVYISGRVSGRSRNGYRVS